MKTSICLLIFFFTSLFAKETIEGPWTSTLVGSSIKLTLNLQVEEDGAALFECIEQGLSQKVKDLSIQNGKVSFSLPALSISFEGTLAEDAIEGTFTQQESFPLTWHRGKAQIVLKRPQLEAVSANAYTSEEIIVQHGEIALSGTFCKPNGQKTFPTVLFIAGSGPHDRDETIFGHKPFLVIADHLAKHGIGSLRLDKRGCGQSSGNYDTSTVYDFANDSKAAVAFLKSHKEVSQIGLLGHSEGGVIAPIVASKSSDVDFVILLAGTGIPGDQLWLVQQRLIGQLEAESPEELDQFISYLEKILSILQKEPDQEKAKELLEQIDWDPQAKKFLIDFCNTPWFRSFVNLDPRTYLKQIKVPTLALFGSLDLQVPPTENLPEMEQAMSQKTPFTSKVFPKLNHLFQTATTGSPEEYFQIEETLSPEVLDTLVEWIETQTTDSH